MKKWAYAIYMMVVAICFLALTLFLGTKLDIEKEKAIAVNGILDLRSYDFNKPVSLKGEWLFYPNQLYEPSRMGSIETKPVAITVPSPWNKAFQSQGYGYGTYQLNIQLDDVHTVLGIKTQVIRSAAKLYVNGVLIHEDGKVGKTPATHVMNNVPATHYFEPKDNQIEILLQVSNFNRDIGGITQDIILGTHDQIQNYNMISYGIDFTGVLLLIGFGLYQLSFYFTLQKEIGFLYSGMLPIFSGLTTLFRNQKVGALLFHFENMELFYRLQLMTSMIAIFFLSLLIYEIGRSRFQKVIVRFYFVVSLAYSLFACFVPYSIHSKYEILYWIAVIITNSVLILSAVRDMIQTRWMFHERQIVVSLTVGIVLSIIGQVDSVLYYFALRDNMLLNYLCNLAFIAILTTFYRQKYQLSELRIAKSEQNLLKTEIAFLQAQIEPHFVFNALNTVISFCYTDPAKAAVLLRDLSKYLRFTFDQERFHKKVTLERELEATKVYLNIEKARFDERFTVDIKMDDSLKSLEVPFLILQPLVENAIKHGILKREAAGRVAIHIVSLGAQVMISVQDDGVGMTVDPSFESYGVGLKNIKRRMEMIPGANMHIDSYLGAGTNVQLYIPISAVDLNGIKV